MSEKKPFMLRINPELWDALQKIASAEFRSVNGQIEFILTEYAKARLGSMASLAEEKRQDD